MSSVIFSFREGWNQQLDSVILEVFTNLVIPWLKLDKQIRYNAYNVCIYI